MAGYKIKDNSREVLERFNRNKEKTLQEIGLKWQEIATKEVTAMGVVDTGRFRASLSYITPEYESGVNIMSGAVPESEPGDVLHGQAPKDAVVVGSNVEYAPYLEYGYITTRGTNIGGRPTVTNAVMNYKGDYMEIIERNMGGGFKIKL